MIIKVSKRFAKFINETATERKVNFFAEVVEISPDRYSYTVGDLDSGEIDYNSQTGKIRTIKINYPVEYYANPVFVSTDDLTRNFRRYHVQDIEGLKDMICDLYAV